MRPVKGANHIVQNESHPRAVALNRLRPKRSEQRLNVRPIQRRGDGLGKHDGKRLFVLAVHDCIMAGQCGNCNQFMQALSGQAARQTGAKAQFYRNRAKLGIFGCFLVIFSGQIGLYPNECGRKQLLI